MKVFLIASYLFLLAAILPSCTNTSSSVFFSANQNKWINTTSLLVNQYPDSVCFMIDSVLKNKFNEKIKDTYVIKLLQLKQKAFARLKLTDSVLVTGEAIREVASEISDSLAMAETLIPLFGGVDYKHIKKAKGFIPGAIYTFTKSGKTYEAAIVNALNGWVLSNEGDYVAAQKYFLKAYQVFEALDSINRLGQVFTMMGNNFASIGSMNESTLYYSKCLAIAQKSNDTLSQVALLMNIGINYRLTNPDTALKIYEQALQLLPANNLKLSLKVKFNRANIYLDKKDFGQAESIMKEILLSCSNAKFLEGVGMANNGLGDVYYGKKRYDEALKSYEKAFQTFKSIGLYPLSMMMQNNMIECFQAMGDYKNAFTNTAFLQKKRDTIFSAEKQLAVHELEKKYQTEKKELENKYLKKNALTRNVAIVILVAVVIALFFLLRKSNWLYKQREVAYSVLMDRYKEERRLRNSEQKTETPSLVTLLAETEVLQEEVLLIHRMEAYYVANKPYLNPKLKVEDIALFLNVTQKEINLVFKNLDKVNFNVFTNRYRVEEARRLFDDTDNLNLKLETIATQSGFGNRQTFYDAFEQFTGVKPGYYRKSILQQNAKPLA